MGTGGLNVLELGRTVRLMAGVDTDPLCCSNIDRGFASDLIMPSSSQVLFRIESLYRC